MFQERSQQYRTVAYLNKPHGVYGMIEAQGDELTATIFNKYDLFWIIDDHNMMVPLRLQSFKQSESGNHPHTFFVQFDGVTSRDKAASMAGITLYMEVKDDLTPLGGELPDEDLLEILEYEILDEDHRNEGVVVDVMQNPAHPIIVTDTGLMIPYVNEFIDSIDDENKIIIGKNLAPLKEI